MELTIILKEEKGLKIYPNSMLTARPKSGLTLHFVSLPSGQCWKFSLTEEVLSFRDRPTGREFQIEGIKGTIINRLIDITEKQASRMVEKNDGGYRLYHGLGHTGDPRKSLASLAYSLGIMYSDFNHYLVLYELEQSR